MKEIKYTILYFVCEKFCDSILLRFRFHYGKKLRFPLFRSDSATLIKIRIPKTRFRILAAPGGNPVWMVYCAILFLPIFSNNLAQAEKNLLALGADYSGKIIKTKK